MGKLSQEKDKYGHFVKKDEPSTAPLKPDEDEEEEEESRSIPSNSDSNR